MILSAGLRGLLECLKPIELAQLRKPGSCMPNSVLLTQESYLETDDVLVLTDTPGRGQQNLCCCFSHEQMRNSWRSPVLSTWKSFLAWRSRRGPGLLPKADSAGQIKMNLFHQTAACGMSHVRMAFQCYS